MQAVVAATMAAQTLLFIAVSSPPTSRFPFSARPFHFSFAVQPLRLAGGTAVAARPLMVVDATKKAVAVLKGTSQVEGVVTLTQEDNDSWAHLGFLWSSKLTWTARATSAGWASSAAATATRCDITGRTRTTVGPGATTWMASLAMTSTRTTTTPTRRRSATIATRRNKSKNSKPNNKSKVKQ